MFDELINTLPPTEADRLARWTADEVKVWDDQTVWTLKGSTAPGALTPQDRLKTLDYMGVNRSFIFSDPGVQAAAMSQDELALPTMRHWNDFIVGFSRTNPDRLRGVAILNMNNIDEAIKEAERVLALGGRAFCVPSSVPPGNQSPASAAMDPLWAMMQEANATVTLHAGGEDGFTASRQWDTGVDHLQFQSIDYSAEGEQIGTYLFSTMSLAPQNYITTLVLGGVFERFPRLRFGVIELGAHWLAPMALHLDNTYKIFKRRFEGVLTMPPSEYIHRNIRVTPYRIENVADYIDRYGLAQCYCYSSDFPHPEGGNAPITDFTRSIDRLGAEMSKGFFVSNAQWVLPAIGN
jgi:predicted TIM-barrel fold metal-dependent hydrolase